MEGSLNDYGVYCRRNADGGSITERSALSQSVAMELEAL
jgi:hypothetical protein